MSDTHSGDRRLECQKMKCVPGAALYIQESSGGIALTELQLYNFPHQSNSESKEAENSPRQLIPG